jgi:hypothetical protein
MARIRTIKPEAFESEDLASVSLTGERTFFGLLTLADDSGRFRDHPAIIAGRLWALRPAHTAAHVADDLGQLAAAGLICRYAGCDGRTYLHIVTWERHQRIDRPSASRVPRCTQHQGHQRCGGCTEERCAAAAGGSDSPAVPLSPRGIFGEGSPSPPRMLDQTVSPDSSPDRASAGPGGAPLSQTDADSSGPSDATSLQVCETAGQSGLGNGATSPRRGSDEGSVSGSRILDPGSVPTGRQAPAPEPAGAGEVSAKALVGEYVRGCAHRPPKNEIAHIGRQVRTLVDEGFQGGTLRAALERLRAKGLHPSVLPSLVNEVLNASPPTVGALPSSASGGGPSASVGTGYTPYLNSAVPAPSTFGGSL